MLSTTCFQRLRNQTDVANQKHICESGWVVTNIAEVQGGYIKKTKHLSHKNNELDTATLHRFPPSGSDPQCTWSRSDPALQAKFAWVCLELGLVEIVQRPSQHQQQWRFLHVASPGQPPESSWTAIPNFFLKAEHLGYSGAWGCTRRGFRLTHMFWQWPLQRHAQEGPKVPWQGKNNKETKGTNNLKAQISKHQILRDPVWERHCICSASLRGVLMLGSSFYAYYCGPGPSNLKSCACNRVSCAHDPRRYKGTRARFTGYTTAHDTKARAQELRATLTAHDSKARAHE